MTNIPREETYETNRVFRVAVRIIGLHLRPRPSIVAVGHAAADGFRRMRDRPEERQEYNRRDHRHRLCPPENAYPALPGVSLADQPHHLPHSAEGRQTPCPAAGRGKGSVPHREGPHEA